MKNRIVVLMCIVVHLCSPPGCIEARSAPLNILDAMKNDPEVCKAVVPLVDSDYSKICEKTLLPIGDVVLNVNDSEQFLCLGLYDRLFRLCYLDSLPKKSASSIDKSQFDSEVQKTEPKTTTDVWGFCQQWNSTYPPRYDKIKGYVAQLEASLKNPIMCVKLCTDSRNEFIPLCSALATMDRISRSIGEQPGAVKAAPQAGAKEVREDRPSGPDVAAASNEIKADAKIAVPQAPAVDQETMNSLEKSPKNVPKSPQAGSTATAAKQEKNQETTQHASSQTTLSKEADAGSTQHVEKVEAKVNASATGTDMTMAHKDAETASEVKKEEPKDDKPGLEKASGTNDSTKTAKSPALSEAAAHGAQNQEVPRADIAEPAGAPLEDSKADVISEHTQDETEDQFGGADPMESMDSPLIDDDVDENSVKLSDKQTYIPRLPRLPDADDSHFFSYFTVFGVIFIASYFGYHNKQKILAMLLEGRRSRGGRNRKRPSTANYRKLDCTLEEAVTSQCNSNVTHVIY